jgi:hypothetical protein
MVLLQWFDHQPRLAGENQRFAGRKIKPGAGSRMVRILPGMVVVLGGGHFAINGILFGCQVLGQIEMFTK